MNIAGRYYQRFAWRVHSYGSPDTFGQPSNAFAASVLLWGYMDVPSSARTSVLDALQNQQIAFVHIRNHVAVREMDTLTDTLFAEMWEVLSVHRDIDGLETVVEVRRRS